jgi:hypothetical protein
MNFGQDNLQLLMRDWSSQWQKERAKTQMTLGKFISRLEEMEPNRLIGGISSRANSYRGYYIDLAFEPAEAILTTESLLEAARKYMGRTLEGYKGGYYVMHENTPIWLASWGDIGLRIMDLNEEEECITLVLSEEEN